MNNCCRCHRNRCCNRCFNNCCGFNNGFNNGFFNWWPLLFFF